MLRARPPRGGTGKALRSEAAMDLRF
jgi:hypothetical protein